MQRKNDTPKEVIMPALGMAQDVGVLLRWLKREGETVEAGEPLMEVATDKVDVQVEAPASGVLTGVTAQEGDEIPVGEVIAYIGEEGTEGAEGAKGTSGTVTASPVAARMAAEHGVDLADVQAAGGRIQKEDVATHLRTQESRRSSEKSADRILASPKARRLAQERDVDLAALTGSGPDGAVLAADVPQPSPPQLREGASTPAPTPLSQRGRGAGGEGLPRVWQVMAQRLSASWTSAPHFYLAREVDASRLAEWRSIRTPPLPDWEREPGGEGKVTYTDLLTKLTALALVQHPRLNASWREGAIVTNEDVNIGLAVAVEEGLLVPVIHSADRLPVAAIAQRRAALVARASSGELLPDDFAGGTFTISNLGMYGVDAFSAIVNPPQAGILAVGRIAERVVAVEGQPAVRPMLTLTLSCDHRVVDGARAAQFLDTLAGLIEEPLRAL